ncbi:hypothetical protein ANCCAN_10344 [Ancylostoma caninum]|uniref:Uncharacterized protein n=1 Tax=Ancylostoma caninum TaxID=29170 RepID=A0A368GKX4_ANCCA|nr:hypothetical protein ANCCAN_10344 [Ancylostoma caninum]
MYAAYYGYDPPTPSNEQESFLSQCHLAGIDGRRLDFPEVYCGKTGLDIPCIQLESFDTEVFASYTGPDGGLTQVSAGQLVLLDNLWFCNGFGAWYEALGC